MVHLDLPWRQPPLTQEQQNDLFMLFLEDDVEDAPWMTMGDLQFWSATGFAHSLRIFAHEQGLGWYVASMLPIEYRWPRKGNKKKLSPDTFVSFVEPRSRTSYDLETEGVFPPFVLEVVSPSSVQRDQVDKREAYELLGAREYALFTPREGAESILEGYRRGVAGAFEVWLPDAEGRLWSDVLGLYLVVRGSLLQAQTRQGRLLLTPPQEAEAHRQEAEARRRAEAEVERLRRELQRYESGHTGEEA